MEDNEAQTLYEIINDFIRQNKIPVIELFGVFEVIKAEQAQYLIEDDEEIE